MSKYPYINNYTISSLEEFHDIIQRISHLCGYVPDPTHPRHHLPLWFRGHEQADYRLLPSLYRQYDMAENSKGTYGAMHLREEYRLHAFQERAYHHIRTNPGTRVDWQEIMQHHLVKTRLMDWTEIAQNALAFALEAYMDPLDNRDTQWRRRTLDPVVWVLHPVQVNSHVFDAIRKEEGGTYPHIRDALRESVDDGGLDDMVQRFGNELNHPNAKQWYLHPDTKEKPDATIGLINISSIDAYRWTIGGSLERMLSSFSFNPFFYLLARLYVDGISIPLSSRLPPLCTLHPYHSERIAAQRGAFTIYPYYTMTSNEEKRKKQLIDPRCMEDQWTLTDCLFEIRILHPAYVARQLLHSGIRRSHLYPELENTAKELESSSLHF